MSRNPHAGALRHFKPKRIDDKRETLLAAANDSDEWHPLPRKTWDE